MKQELIIKDYRKRKYGIVFDKIPFNKDKRRVLSEQEIIDIRKRYNQGEDKNILAKEFNVTTTTINYWGDEDFRKKRIEEGKNSLPSRHHKIFYKSWYKRNKERDKKYRSLKYRKILQENPNHFKELYQRNPNKTRNWQKQLQKIKLNPIKFLEYKEYHKQWRKTHPEKVKEYNKQYQLKQKGGLNSSQP